MSSEKLVSDPKMHFIGGATSGLVSVLLLQPFDLVKTRLQQEKTGFFRALHEAASPSIFRLWRGTCATILRNVPGHALYFTSLDLTRRTLSQLVLADGNRLSKEFVNLIGGASTRVAVGFVLMPMTVMKTRYESNLYNYNSLWSAYKTIMKNEGIRGLFAGYGSTAIRDAPYAGIYLLFYEWSRALMHEKIQSEEFKPAINMVFGIAAAVLSSVVTHPFDVIRTRIQVRPKEYKNIFDATVKIFKEEGMRAFMSGIAPRLARKPLSAGITWSMYEEIVRVAK